MTIIRQCSVYQYLPLVNLGQIFRSSLARFPLIHYGLFDVIKSLILVLLNFKFKISSLWIIANNIFIPVQVSENSKSVKFFKWWRAGVGTEPGRPARQFSRPVFPSPARQFQDRVFRARPRARNSGPGKRSPGLVRTGAEPWLRAAWNFRIIDFTYYSHNQFMRTVLRSLLIQNRYNRENGQLLRMHKVLK